MDAKAVATMTRVELETELEAIAGQRAALQERARQVRHALNNHLAAEQAEAAGKTGPLDQKVKAGI